MKPNTITIDRIRHVNIFDFPGDEPIQAEKMTMAGTGHVIEIRFPEPVKVNPGEVIHVRHFVEPDGSVTDVQSEVWPGDRPHFILRRYNPRRRARGAEAAEFEVRWPDGDDKMLWMTERDIRANAKQWGLCMGLRDGLEAYEKNQPFPK